MLLSTFFFFIASQISYFSIIGFGSLFQKKPLNNIILNNFINFFIGLILLNLIGQILYYLNLNSKFLNLFVLIFGFWLFCLKNDKKIFLTLILINLIFFSGLIISKLHEDWPYHFNFIEQVSSNRPIIGIANVDDIHILSVSFFSFIQKLFYLPIFQFKLILIPVYLVYLNIVAFLIQNLLFNFNSKKLSQIFIIILTILTIKLARISEFGYDYLSNLILLKIVILYLVNHFDKKNNILFKNFYVLLFVYSISIKITALFFTPILVYFLISDFNKEKKIYFDNSYNFLFCILVVFILLESFLRSGCFIYFAELTCLDSKYVSWSIDYERVIDHSKHVELWAKGFYVQDLIMDPTLYLSIKNWFNIWLNNHFFYKIIEFIIIPIILIIYFFIKGNINYKNKEYYFLFFSSILSIVLWFNYLPQLRFGFTNLIVFFICIHLIYLEPNAKIINKNNYFIFICILVIFFNIKNIDRINNEFKRNDVHKFNNFPYPPKKRLMKSNISNNSTKFLLHQGKTINEYEWFIIIN